MKATELRVTNFVLNDGVVNVIIFIGYDSVQLITNQGNNITAHLDLIKPIQLTEDWLLRFGFEEFDGDWTNQKCLLFGVNFDGFRKEPTHIWDGAFSGAEIKYVHQLQNLYFALTGKELIYNQGYVAQDSSENITLD